MSSDEVQDRIAEMRAVSTDGTVSHHGMCSTIIDQDECDCYVSSYAVWADYIEAALNEGEQ